MRFLVDENIPGPIVKAMISSGHDVLWIQEFEPGVDDRKFLAYATGAERTLITFDKDFGELVFQESESSFRDNSASLPARSLLDEPSANCGECAGKADRLDRALFFGF